MTKAVWGARIRLAGACIVFLSSVSCGEMTRQGTSPAYLVINSLQAASGALPDEYGTILQSDVLTVVEGQSTFFGDLGRVEFALALKDPGSTARPTQPTSANWITVNRYRVTFIRSDGRNTPGVDVPYPFDGAFTATVSGDVIAGFTLVRHVAKVEAPLAALARSPVIISTIAEVTFYGHDQTGREVSATGRIGVDFGNFADPNN